MSLLQRRRPHVGLLLRGNASRGLKGFVLIYGPNTSSINLSPLALKLKVLEIKYIQKPVRDGEV